MRSVPNLEQRLHEAERIGFERAVIPKHSLAHLNAADYPGMKLVGAAYIADAIKCAKKWPPVMKRGTYVDLSGRKKPRQARTL